MKNINNQEIKKQINLIINLNDKIYFRKSRLEYEGEIVGIDACKNYWIDESYSHLYAVYDPTIKEIKALYLGKEETIKNYYETLKIMILNKEILQLFKGNCRSLFVISKKDAGAFAHKDVNTQFGLVLNTIGH